MPTFAQKRVSKIPRFDDFTGNGNGNGKHWARETE